MQKYTRHCECLVLLQMYNDTETIFRDLLTYINDYEILEYFCPLSHFGKTTVFQCRIIYAPSRYWFVTDIPENNSILAITYTNLQFNGLKVIAYITDPINADV